MTTRGLARLTTSMLAVGLLLTLLQTAFSNAELSKEERLKRQDELARTGLRRRLTSAEHAELDALEALAENDENNHYSVRLGYCDHCATNGLSEESTQGGRLEFFYRDQWGTVCGNTFTNEAAQVACRSLGYEKSVGIYLHQTYGPGDHLRIVLSDVNCTGNETHLDVCEHRHWADPHPSCTHDQDVSIACLSTTEGNNVHHGYKARFDPLATNVTGATRRGRLEIHYNETWGSVCDGWFDDCDATVACNTIYTGGETSYWEGKFENRMFGPGLPGQKIWIGASNCTGNELNLGSCPHPAWGKHTCNHQDDVSISCTLIIGEPPLRRCPTKSTPCEK